MTCPITRLAGLLILLGAGLAVNSAGIAQTTDLRLLFFTQNGCPPCRQTEPHIERLRAAEAGVVQVETIHLEHHAGFAAQCGVTHTPTIIIAEGHQVLRRHTGPINYAELQGLIAPFRSLPHQTPTESAGPPSGTLGPSNANTSASRTAMSAVQTRAHRATVRLRVADSGGTGYATGTIIHRANDEALILTCGHVFRESKGQGKIKVDLGFDGPNPVTVDGNLVAFDADAHDVALVAIPCTLDIDPVPLAAEMRNVAPGESAFSFGCDQGAAPSLRQTQIKNITRYSGVAKFDIVGRPIDGRSGGGLFTTDGELMGVCNAAAIEVDEGIYAGLESIYWQLAKSNLASLFRNPQNGNANASNATVAQAPQPPVRGQGIPVGGASWQREKGAQPPWQQMEPSTSPPPVQPAIQVGDPPQPFNAAESKGTAELIVVVRNPDSPGSTETLTIRNPSPELLHMLRSSRQTGANGESAMPQLQPQTH